MAEYKTEDERRAERAKAQSQKLAADERIAIMTKEKEENDLKLRKARKEKSEADKRAKDATLAANAKSNTFPAVSVLFVAPTVGTPIVATAVAIADGRLGSKEDVASWVAAGVGLLGAVGGVLADSPSVALSFASLLAGGLSSTGSRRGRDWGAKMRADSGGGAG
jgi:hypothetical protein